MYLLFNILELYLKTECYLLMLLISILRDILEIFLHNLPCRKISKNADWSILATFSRRYQSAECLHKSTRRGRVTLMSLQFGPISSLGNFSTRHFCRKISKTFIEISSIRQTITSSLPSFTKQH